MQTMMDTELEVLLEFDGSRRQLTSTRESLVDAIVQEVKKVAGISVNLAIPTDADTQPGYILQRWSEKWGVYIDVLDLTEIQSGDKVKVLRRPDKRGEGTTDDTPVCL